MFEFRSAEAPAGGGADYGYIEPLAPGAVDPVRLAALMAGFDAGGELLDPAEDALYGPEPGVDPAELLAAMDPTPTSDRPPDEPPDVPSDVRSGTTGVVEPSVLVPVHLPGVEGMPPGPELASILDSADVSGLGAYEVVEAVAGWQRIVSWATAGQAAAITELARRAEMRPVQAGRVFESMSAQRLTAMEVAARLCLTPHAGEAVVARALCLSQLLPATQAALAAGRIDPRRAEVLADELGRHQPETARAVEAQVIDRAEALTAPRLRRAVKDAAHRLAPATTERRREQATQQRFVRVSPAADGMAWLEAYLPAADAAAVKATLDAAAAAMKRSTPDDRRTMAARRADALAQMGWIALSTGRLGGCACGQRLDNRHRRPVAVQVTVAMTTLLGLDELPGQLAGYGPIPASVARRLAAQGTWRRLITDPTSGALLDYGRTRYQPPQDLVDHVVARDQSCRWVTCDWPAAGCEIDHTIAYPHGPTAVGDLGLFCKAHHIPKHHSRWKINQPQPGRFQWTSPTGHTYTVHPDPLGPIHAETTGGEENDPDPPPDDIPPF